MSANDQAPEVFARRFRTHPCPACQVSIIWATRDKGWIMLDAQPVTPGAWSGRRQVAVRAADVLLTDLGPRLYPRARVVTSQADLFGKDEVYQRHIRTCAHKDALLARLARRRGRKR